MGPRILSVQIRRQLALIVLIAGFVSQVVTAAGAMHDAPNYSLFSGTTRIGPTLSCIVKIGRRAGHAVSPYFRSALYQQFIYPIEPLVEIGLFCKNQLPQGVMGIVQPVCDVLFSKVDQSTSTLVHKVDLVSQNLANQVTQQAASISTNIVTSVDKSMTTLSANTLQQVHVLSDHTVNRVDAVSTKLVSTVDQTMQSLVKQTTSEMHSISSKLIQEVDARTNLMLQNTLHTIDTMQDKVIANVDTKVDKLITKVDVMRDDTLRQVDERLNKTLKNGAILTSSVIVTSILAWYAFKFIHTQLDKHYGKPKLFSHTSTKNLYQRIKEFIHKPVVELPVIISSPEKERLLDGIIDSAKIINAKIKAGNPHLKYSNLLLWGPPGTGKTMFAQKLARASGMEFRMMSGADVSKLELGDALVALDEVFNFAKKNKQGLVLFIDEADSFLADRTKLKTDSPTRKLVDKFLSETGSSSNKVMLVFATNHEDVLDEAVKDRITESIKMELPNHDERAGILKLYRDKHLMDPEYNSAEFIISVTTHLGDDKLEQVASQLDGLSGRNLENVIYGFRNSADLTVLGVLTPDIIKAVVKRALMKHAQFNQKLLVPKQVQPQLLSPAAQELLMQD